MTPMKPPGMKKYFPISLDGPAATEVREAVREKHEQVKAWPYPWEFPPPGAVRVAAGQDATGTLIIPVAGTATQGLLYTVPEGFQFCLTHLVVSAFNSGVAIPWNPGDTLWSLTANQNPGITVLQGYAVEGFSKVDVPLGTLQIPWPLEMAEVFDENDGVRVTLTNVNLSTGAPNVYKSILLGWRWPVQ